MSPEIGNTPSQGTLGAYLIRFEIPLSTWGQDTAKTIPHLLSEIRNGDCELVEEDGLIRRVHFVNISVHAQFDGKEHTLVEDRQVFGEGTPQERTRRRKLPGAVSEKIHCSENPDNSVQRALQEELGIKGEVFFKKTHSKNINSNSPSYPGLRTQYQAYFYDVILTGPQIQKEGYREIQLDKTTYFVWT